MRNALVSLLTQFRALSPVRRGLIVVLAIFVGLLIFARISPQPTMQHARTVVTVPETKLPRPNFKRKRAARGQN